MLGFILFLDSRLLDNMVSIAVLDRDDPDFITHVNFQGNSLL